MSDPRIEQIRTRLWHGWTRDELLLLMEDERERLRAAQRTLWMIIASNDGYVLEKEDRENYPGDDRARIEAVDDPVSGDVIFRATIDEQSQPGEGNG